MRTAWPAAPGATPDGIEGAAFPVEATRHEWPCLAASVAPEALARYQREELERWGAVIRRANITVNS